MMRVRVAYDLYTTLEPLFTKTHNSKCVAQQKPSLHILFMTDKILLYVFVINNYLFKESL